ncbi:hypothetical protein HYPSUDRAFT_58682 [Hypholoma sublateritium FD-334 SS-4]|uniref:Uncharacterized protein n=1 Tax=Hypholoma sublateritium (strain FD-334 SS-4) TaxID=945553 RepID=A0A0D2KM95_HYPSF|nr:hypothetical protein HYPSUDRAFT_58682 [Hypholoma sublateritium FD-334 SS-4]
MVRSFQRRASAASFEFKSNDKPPTGGSKREWQTQFVLVDSEYLSRLETHIVEIKTSQAFLWNTLHKISNDTFALSAAMSSHISMTTLRSPTGHQAGYVSNTSASCTDYGPRSNAMATTSMPLSAESQIYYTIPAENQLKAQGFGQVRNHCGNMTLHPQFGQPNFATDAGQLAYGLPRTHGTQNVQHLTCAPTIQSKQSAPLQDPCCPQNAMITANMSYSEMLPKSQIYSTAPTANQQAPAVRDIDHSRNHWYPIGRQCRQMNNTIDAGQIAQTLPRTYGAQDAPISRYVPAPGLQSQQSALPQDSCADYNTLQTSVTTANISGPSGASQIHGHPPITSHQKATAITQERNTWGPIGLDSRLAPQMLGNGYTGS